LVVNTGAGAWVVVDGDSDGDSDGDRVGDGDGGAVSGVSGRSSGIATTLVFALCDVDDFDGAGPTIAPSAPRPPQQTTSVEVIPNPTTDAIRCRFDMRAHSSGNPTMRSSHRVGPIS
jgi:hypothetical protein